MQIVPPKVATKTYFYNGQKPYRKGCKRSYVQRLSSFTREGERGRGGRKWASPPIAMSLPPPSPPKKWARHQGDTLTLFLFLSPPAHIQQSTHEGVTDDLSLLNGKERKKKA